MESDELSFWSLGMGQLKLNLGNLENLVSNEKQNAGGGDKSCVVAKERKI